MTLVKDLQFYFSNSGAKWGSVNSGSVPFRRRQSNFGWLEAHPGWPEQFCLLTTCIFSSLLSSPHSHPQPKSQIGAGLEANTGPPAELQTAVVGCEEEAHSAFTDQTAQTVWARGSGGLHLWPRHSWPPQRSGTKVGSMPWICTDYGTGFVFPVSRCFFAPLNCSGGRELTSRSTWKMHGQDVSNCVTVALCKGVITLNNAHAFTWQAIKTPVPGKQHVFFIRWLPQTIAHCGLEPFTPVKQIWG